MSLCFQMEIMDTKEIAFLGPFLVSDLVKGHTACLISLSISISISVSSLHANVPPHPVVQQSEYDQRSQACRRQRVESLQI